jgi:hypothetical protein
MTTVTQLPLPIPTTTQPESFSPRADAIFSALPAGIVEMNSQANEVVLVQQDTDSKLGQIRTIAQASSNLEAAVTATATAASFAAQAQIWVSGTTYTQNNYRTSPINALPYRRLTNGAGTTDPSLDTTNWKAVSLETSTGFPKVRPVIAVDFASSKVAPKNISFARSSEAYYTSNEFFISDQNLLKFSENLQGSGWATASGAAVTTGFTAPNGLASASRLTHPINALNGTLLYAEQNLVDVSSKTFTVSIWLKSNTGSSQTITLSCVQSGIAPTTSTVTVTTSWQRFSVTRVNTSAASTAQGLYLSAGSNSAGDFLVFGAQLEEAGIVGVYSKTTGQAKTTKMLKMKKSPVDSPRISFDPITRECNGIHIEHHGVGLWKDNAAVNGIATNNSTIANAALAPDGTNSAGFMSASNSMSTKWISGNITHSNTASKILSAYVKPFGVTKVMFNLVNGSTQYAAYFDLVSKEVNPATSANSAGIIDIGGGWLRIWAQIDVANTVAGQHSQWIQLLDDSWNSTFQGDGYSGVYIWGVQYETSEVLTSLMPLVSNYGARSQDLLAIPGQYQDYGSLYIDYQIPIKSKNYQMICTLSASASSWIDLISVPGNDTYLGARVITGGAVRTSADSSQNIIGSFNKVCISFDNSTKTITNSLNGSISASMSPTDYPTPLQNLYVGRYIDSNYALDGFIRKVLVYPRVLSTSELQSLTQN